jgi:hypothetical protein
MRSKWITLAAIALVGTGTAQGGNPIQSNPIKAKVAAPVFLGPTPACAAYRVHTRLVSEAGVVIGASLFCVASASFNEALLTQTQAGTLELHLPGGEIVTRATIVDDFSVYPIVQTISGTVENGNGVYRGATGTLSGGGTIVFDSNGDPVPDSTLVIDLG